MRSIFNIHHSLYTLHKQYHIISFDIFDTLIKRKCHFPSDIFNIVEQINNEKQCNITNFKEKRIEAERYVRSSEKKEEITLDEIYSYLSDKFGIDKKIANIEIQVEKEQCVPNNNIVNIYNSCRDNIRIITSDMYLPLETIKEILHHCGIDEPDYLFLSCEENATKRSGGLYLKIKKTLNVHKHEMIHIGDNFKSDYLMPKFCGIASYWYRVKSYDKL